MTATVRATNSTYRFVGTEHPALNDTPLEILVGAPVQVGDELAEYLGTLDGLEVTPNHPPTKATKPSKE